MASSTLMGFTAMRLVRTTWNSVSSFTSNSAGTLGVSASWRRRLDRRVLFLRIWRSMVEQAASMAPRMSPSLDSSWARNRVLPLTMVISTTQRWPFSTEKVTSASASSRK